MNNGHGKKTAKEYFQGRNKNAWLGACFGASLLLSATVTEAAMVRFDPSSLTVNLGNVFSMDIIAEGFTTTTEGGGLNLSFDQSIVNVNSVSLDATVWEFFTTTGIVNNGTGTVSDMIFASFAGRTGNFDIGTVFFTAIGPGTSNLGLTSSLLNPFAGGGEVIPVTFTNGSVSVVPLPAALWFLLSGMGTLWLAAKRRVAS